MSLIEFPYRKNDNDVIQLNCYGTLCTLSSKWDGASQCDSMMFMNIYFFFVIARSLSMMYIFSAGTMKRERDCNKEKR